MLKDIVQVKHQSEHRLKIRFEDGVEGVIDVSELVQFRGIMAPLADPTYLAQVRVNPDTGTVCWPNGADLDPGVLYAAITGDEICLGAPAGDPSSGCLQRGSPVR